jgi:O-antigen/teichoic acid export membrane protein
VLVIAVAAPWLASFFLASSAADIVATVRWIALAVLLNVAGTYALAVLNGYRSYPFLAVAQVAGPAALVMLLGAAGWWHLPPDPLLLSAAFVLCFGVTCLVGAFGVSRLPGLAGGLRLGTLPRAQSRAFARFAVSNLVAALSTTVALLLIRSWVIESKGLAFSGLFDAGWTLTFNYTTLFLTACSAIYLPRLTAAVRPEDRRACMLKTAYLVLGVGILACHAMVLLKEPLISLLYSPQFHASGEVLTVLVIAVLFRGVSWVYGTLILATRKSRVLVVSDVALNLLLLASTRYALDSFGSLQALSWAFVLPNFLYLVFVVEYACFYNPLMRRRDIWPLLLGGALPLFYFALAHSASQWAFAGFAGGLAAAVGLCAGAAALLAYKKVTP